MTFYFIGCVLSVVLFYLHTYFVRRKTGMNMLSPLTKVQVVVSYGMCFFVSWLGVIFLTYSMWESRNKGLM